MVDVDRAAVSRFLFRRLASDADLRSQVAAVAPDGSRPIVVGAPDDTMSSVLAHLDAVGGNGNVVVPLLGGIVVLAMTRSEDREMVERASDDRDLTPECTLGVFVQRVSGDTNRSYRFIFEHDGHTDSGVAELVAIRG